MTTCTLLIGAPGSGKSYYAGSLRSPRCVVLDRSDYLVSMIGVRKYYHFVRRIADTALLAAWDCVLHQGVDVVIMDWGKTPRERARWLAQARAHSYRTRIVWFDTPADICLMRIRHDSTRSRTTRWRILVAHWFRDFIPPQQGEADELVIIRPSDAVSG